MKYQIKKTVDLIHIDNSQNTSLDLVGLTCDEFSMTYINFDKGRDPFESDKVLQINENFSATYVVIEGSFMINLYENKIVKNINLKKMKLSK